MLQKSAFLETIFLLLRLIPEIIWSKNVPHNFDLCALHPTAWFVPNYRQTAGEGYMLGLKNIMARSSFFWEGCHPGKGFIWDSILLCKKYSTIPCREEKLTGINQKVDFWKTQQSIRSVQWCAIEGPHPIVSQRSSRVDWREHVAIGFI